MPVPLTKQQQQVIDTLKRPDVSMVTCPAVAGAGKTHLLVEMADQLDVTRGLYIAYNKAIQVEAEAKFAGTNIKCSTIHSLAYQAVVKPYKLSVGFFKASSIKERISPQLKKEVLGALDTFCLSAYTDPNEYLATTTIDPNSKQLVLEYLDKMANGDIQCTHSFYLKLYHIYLVSGEIKAPEVDLLMLDEAGDLTALTIEIFRLIKADKKVAVGDLFQNVYSFNNTINGFIALATEATEVPLTQSFRVSNMVAPKIENFIALHLDPTFEFIGQNFENYNITTAAYIARNNSGLLEMMFTLMESDSCFHTTRPVSTILELPLILANLGNGKRITAPGHWNIEKLRSAWEKSTRLQQKYPTVGSYVMEKNEDEDVERAFNVLKKHGPRDLNKLAKYAKEASKKPCDLTLTTAHSSKGLEFSSVTIAPDLNESVTKALIAIRAYKQGSYTRPDVLNRLQEELRLYYVAISRSMYELHNAKHL